MRGKQRSVSPVVAMVLIIALAVASAATVYIVVVNFMNQTNYNIAPVSSVLAYDYNNDTKIDVLKVKLENVGSSSLEISYIAIQDANSPKQWFKDPNSPSKLDAKSSLDFTFFTNSSSSQLSSGQDVIMFIGKSVNDFATIKLSIPTQINLGTPVTVTVLSAGSPVVGSIISFTQASGLPASVPPQSTDGKGQVKVYLLPNYYYATTSNGVKSKVFFSLDEPSITINGTAQKISVKVVDSKNQPLSGISVYAADKNQNDIGKSTITNSSGLADMVLAEGSFLLRASYLSQNYWSSQINVPSSTKLVTIKITSGTLNGSIYFGKVQVKQRLYVRLYTSSNATMNQGQWTNSSGYFSFTNGVVSGLYRLRLQYSGRYFWSGILSTSTPDLQANFGGGIISINITAGNYSLRRGVLTRLFTDTNTYTSRYSWTNTTGGVNYGAYPGGNYKVRIDWLRKYTFSKVFENTGTALHLDFAGGKLIVQVRLNDTTIRGGVLTRLFLPDNNYTYLYGWTNSSGFVNYGVVLAGNYKLRVDWLRKYVYTSEFYHDGLGTKFVDVNGFKLSVKVNLDGQSIRSGVLTRLFLGSSTTYTYLYAYVNSTGYANYGGILSGIYRLRIDWLRQYVYSSDFVHNTTGPKTVNLAGGRLLIQVKLDNSPIRSGVLTRLFLNGSNTYTYLYAYTNGTGWVDYGGVLQGNYKLRIDWMRQYQFSSGFFHNSSAPKSINMQGGRLVIHLTSGNQNLRSGILTRLFLNGSNTYTYLYAYTNASSYVDFGGILPGVYQLRIDWLRMYTFTVGFDHQNSTAKSVNVQGGTLSTQVKIGGTPVQSGVLVRLFTNSFSYTYLYAYTNSSGYANFGNVIGGNFSMRVDWQRQYTYSGFLIHNDSTPLSFSLDGTGKLLIRVRDNANSPLAGSQLIRLFLTPGNSYTYIYRYTNGTGYVQFNTILANTYQLRWDNQNPDWYSNVFTVNNTASATVDITVTPTATAQNVSNPLNPVRVTSVSYPSHIDKKMGIRYPLIR